MVRGDPLGDGAAQGRADEVRGVDAVPVQHGEAVGGHVRQRVGVRREVDAVGAAGVAVVEADHLPSSGDQCLHQLVRPADGR